MPETSTTVHRVPAARIGGSHTAGSAPGRVKPKTTGVRAAQVAKVLAAARSVVLVGHINPDADSLGSALALALSLQQLGTQVSVAFDFPVETPESLRSLPGQHLITRDPRVDPDVMIALDVASVYRLGGLAGLLTTAGTSVVVDHHASNPGFGDLAWVEPHAEATVVLVAELIDRLGTTLTPDIAANLYAGLATDTVNFRFATSAGHLLAARLIAAGVQAEAVMQPIMDTHPFCWLNMLSEVLGAATLDPAAADGAGLVTVRVMLEQSNGLRQEELDSIIDIVRTSGEAGVAAVIKQTDTQEWQVSLRSKNGVDVGATAAALGGGGHPRAAGYGFTGGYGELIAELTAALAHRERRLIALERA